MEKEFRADEDRVRNDTRERSFAHHCPEFPMVRRMTLGMNSPLVVPSMYARAAVEKQQNGWDLLFIGYSAAVDFHTCDINSWTTQAKNMRGLMPPKFEVRDILRKLDQADLENMLPVWDDGRTIVEEGHIALKVGMKFARGSTGRPMDWSNKR